MRCSHQYHYYGDRCSSQAGYHLHDQDGHSVPGAYLCSMHAVAAVDEYASKLDQTWSARPVDEYGVLISTMPRYEAVRGLVSKRPPRT